MTLAVKKFYRQKKFPGRSKSFPGRVSVRSYGPERPVRMLSAPRRYMRYTPYFPDLFPEKKQCSIVYSQSGTLTAGAVGTTVATAFRCNSIFDPDWTGVGHQPKHHDLLSEVYERYCVVNADIEVLFYAAPSTSTQQQAGVFITTRPTGADAVGATNSYSDLIENGRITVKPLGFRDGGSDVTRVTATYTPEHMYGGPAINEDDNQALFGANPSKTPLWWIGAAPIRGGETLTDIGYVVKITYNVVCFRKKHDLVAD